jgi:ech hydrogenase subunit F
MRSFMMTKIVFRNLLAGPATLMYPKKKREFTPITRGSIEVHINECIFCGLCSRRCPTYALTVSKESKEWQIDRLKCCTCNLCVEICPKKCLVTGNQYSPPLTDKMLGIHTVKKEDETSAA